MHVQFNSLTDYAESLELITFVVFLLLIENFMSALSESSFSRPCLNATSHFFHRAQPCCVPAVGTDAATQHNKAGLRLAKPERINYSNRCSVHAG